MSKYEPEEYEPKDQQEWAKLGSTIDRVNEIRRSYGLGNMTILEALEDYLDRLENPAV